MVEGAPRDHREWMRTVERQLKEARRNGRILVAAQLEGQLDTIREEIAAVNAVTPAAPIELTYQTALYVWTNYDRADVRGRLILDFPDVVKATDGSDIIVDAYELYGRKEGRGNYHSAYPGHLLPGASYPGSPGSLMFTGELAPLQQVARSSTSSFRVNGFLPGDTWRFKVRALGGTVFKPGVWSTEIVVDFDKDTTPLAQPTAPTVTADRGVLIVEHDGLSVNGAFAADFLRLEIAHGPAASPTTIVGKLGRGGGQHIIGGLPYYTPQFVRVRAVDESGNFSPWSEQATAFLTPLVNTDIILSEIDAAETNIKNLAEAFSDPAAAEAAFASYFVRNKIAAEHLFIGSGLNLIPNGMGDFKEPAGWSKNLIQDTDLPVLNGIPVSGIHYSYKTPLGHDVVSTDQTVTYALEPNTEYTFDFWAKSSENVAGTVARLTMRLPAQDGLGVNLNGGVSWSAIAGKPAPSPSGQFPVSSHIVPKTWTHYWAKVTTGNHVHTGFVGAISGSVADTEQIWIAGLNLKPRLNGTLIVENAIETRHLVVTEDMTVALLAAHKIVAGEIDTNSLTADTGFIGYLESRLIRSDVFIGKAFEGGTFTGSVFQTSASANTGVIFDSAGLRAYTPGGTVAFNLPSSSGRGIFSGRVSTALGNESGSTLLPAADSASGTASGMFISLTSTLVGGDTAGVWVDDTTNTTLRDVNVRGWYGGGVSLNGQLVRVPNSGARIGNYGSWALGDATVNGNNYLPNLYLTGGYLRLSNAPTTSAAAQCVLASNPEGVFYRSTSDRAFKADIRPFVVDKRALQLKPYTWVDRQPMDPAKPFVRYVGYMADEVATLFPEATMFDEWGQPASVQYDRLPSPATLAILKDHEQQLLALTAAVAALTPRKP